MNNKNIVFVAINRKRFIFEMMASFQSFLQHTEKNKEQYRIILYTNQYEHLKNYANHPYSQLKIVEVSDEMLRKWAGRHKYLYNIKIYALLDCLERYREPTILIDTDTFFIKDVGALFNYLEKEHTFLLNYKENSVNDILLYDKESDVGQFTHNELQVNSKDSINSKYTFNLSTEFWNSGVIGVRAENVHCLHEALELSNYLFENYHIRTAEQIALSIVFQYYGQIVSCDHIVFHYWFLKEVRYLLEVKYGYSTEIDNQHINSFIVKEMKNLQVYLQETDLLQTIIYFTKYKSSYPIRDLLKVVNQDSYIGKLLRNS